MTRGENIYKAVRFEGPEYIPMTFAISGACWNHYDNNQLQDLMEEHSFLFPDFERKDKVTPSFGLCARKDEPYTDPWGCVWETTEDGIVGTVHQHPLEDWTAFANYTPPNPETTNGTTPVNWDNVRKSVEKTREKGGFVHGGLPHGHTFLRLQDIRGYERIL